MKIRLNPEIADHCMRMWFDADKVYDAQPAKNAHGKAYRLASEQGWTDNYSARFFEVVEA